MFRLPSIDHGVNRQLEGRGALRQRSPSVFMPSRSLSLPRKLLKSKTQEKLYSKHQRLSFLSGLHDLQHWTVVDKALHSLCLCNRMIQGRKADREKRTGQGVFPCKVACRTWWTTKRQQKMYLRSRTQRGRKPWNSFLPKSTIQERKAHTHVVVLLLLAEKPKTKICQEAMRW